MTAKHFHSPPHWTLAQRIEHYSAPPDDRGCRVWTGARARAGYGQMGWKGRVQPAHRLSWMAARGPIENGLFVLHRCDNPPCCNPDHLFLGTQAENVADRDAKGRRPAPPRGEKNWTSKLTNERVLEIFKAPGLLKEISERFGISITHVSRIKRRAVWQHATAHSDGLDVRIVR